MKSMTSKILSFLLFINFLIFPCVLMAQSRESSTETISAANKNEEKKLGGRLTAYGNMGGKINPAGLGFFGGISYRNVYQYDDRYDMASGYVQTGMGLGVSPAMMQVQAHVEWQPWIFLPLRIQYDYYEYFGASGGLLSFGAPDVPYGDDVRKLRSDEERTHGQRFLFQPTLQGKINRWIIRNQTDFAYYQFSGRGPYFLELVYDTLLKNGDYLLSNRTHFLYSILDGSKDKTLLAGPFYEVTRAYDARITQQKIGLALYWEPAASLCRLQSPRLGVMTGYHLEDPNRQGQFFLMMGAGFQFNI